MDIIQFIFLAVRRALFGEDMLPEKMPDLKKVYAAAQKRGIENIVAYGLWDRRDSFPEDVWSLFEKSIYRAMAQEARQEKALAAFLEVLGHGGIPHMILKGYVLKKLYPSSDMRYMGDIDILIPPEKKETAREILHQMGFRINFENMRELNAVNDAGVDLEIHFDMVSPDYKVWHAYYEDIWERAIKGERGAYFLSDEDYFIYHIVHLTKHYKGTGIGPRVFLDVFLYLSKKRTTLDFAYLEAELGKLGLWGFTKNVIALSEMWFGEGERTPLLSDMEAYVLESDLYGSRAHAAAFGALDTIRKGKLKRIFRILFPTMHTMSILYPALRNKKYLLWYYYIKRLFDRAFHGRRSAVPEKNAETAKKAAEIAAHFEALGL